LSGAVHERIATVHAECVAGAVDHEPLVQVEETLTEVQLVGEVTDVAVYESHVVPSGDATQAPDAGQPPAHEALAYGATLHEPSLQVEVSATEAQVPVGVATEYEVQVPSFAVRGQPPVAGHERIATAHEAFVPGAIDHEPLTHIDETLTEVQLVGEVTEAAVYETQAVPSGDATQAPVAGQPAAHVALKRGTLSHAPLVQVEVCDTAAHDPIGAAEEYVTQVEPFGAVAQTPVAGQPDEHEALSNGASLHAPLVQVEVRATEAQLSVGVAEEYVVQVPPSAVSAQAPLGAQTCVQLLFS
jgi:hypothetical protein